MTQRTNQATKNSIQPNSESVAATRFEIKPFVKEARDKHHEHSSKGNTANSRTTWAIGCMKTK